jgi:hypothetical protein
MAVAVSVWQTWPSPSRWPAQRLPFGFRARQARPGALDQQVAFHLGHGGEDVEYELAGGRGEIELTELQHNDFDVVRGQGFDGGADVLRVAAEPVKLRQDQGFPIADLSPRELLRRRHDNLHNRQSCGNKRAAASDKGGDHRPARGLAGCLSGGR